jgi:hypothetical protein
MMLTRTVFEGYFAYINQGKEKAKIQSSLQEKKNAIFLTVYYYKTHEVTVSG